MEHDQLLRTLSPLLRRVSTLTLATVDEAGAPHAASLYFAADADLNLYYLSSPASAHSRHLAQRPEVAATIHLRTDPWQQISGVQMHGHGQAVSPERLREAERIYAVKFPFLDEVPMSGEMAFYWIRPTWIRWIDNSVGFGQKVETVLRNA